MAPAAAPDVAAQANFAEAHLTTGRFSQAEGRLAALLAQPDLDPEVTVALRILEIATLLASGKGALIPDRIATLQETIAAQPEAFKVEWSFEGTRHFVDRHAGLAFYRNWLLNVLDAAQSQNRASIVARLRVSRSTFPERLGHNWKSTQIP